MVEKIKQIDTELFLLLNGLHNEFFDTVMWWVSETWFWTPVYLLLLFLIYRKYSLKLFFTSLVFIALVVLLCDRSSVVLFKEFFQRYRPCHNLEIQHLVHTVNGHCGGLYSFVSSHACNHFGLAVFAAGILERKNLLILLIIWAAIIGYSRIYLGVHYPADVLGGGLVGVLIGYFLSRSYIFAARKIQN